MGLGNPCVHVWGDWYSKSISVVNMLRILKVFKEDVRLSPNGNGNLDIIRENRNGDYERIGFLDIKAEKVVRLKEGKKNEET
jgi:hypothetical protein